MPYKPICGVYKITNIVNSKYYIGSATSIRFRLNTHKRLLKDNKHFNNHLQSSYNKYGLSNFTFEQLEVTTKETMIEKEQYWIDYLNATNPKKGYNKRIIASSNLGIKASEQTRMKLSLAHMGHKRSPETQAKISAAQHKAVIQIDFAGNVVKEFSSFKEAAQALKLHRTSISMCCSGKLTSTGGFYWCKKEKLADFVIPDLKHKKSHTVKHKTLWKRKNSNAACT